jgi:heme/copper-type cytochrome/quinol oxidase subunit 3
MSATTVRQSGSMIDELSLENTGQRAPGWWGMVLLIVTEATLFASLIAGYFYLQSNADSWPPAGTEVPELLLPLIGTVLLVGSSLPMWWADRSIAAGNHLGLRIGLALGFLMGAAFLGIQIVEYSRKTFDLDTNTYSSLFFTITGLHGLHVLIGLLMNLYVQLRAWLGHFSPRRRLAVQNTVLYWHFVDAVWIVILATVYLSPRWL